MKTDEAKALLQQLLEKMGFVIDDILIEEKSEGEYLMNILSESDAAQMIGSKGDVLFSLQQVAKGIFRSQEITTPDEHVKIDVDSYRLNQESNVLEMAEKVAQSVLNSGNSASLPPMSGYFRRIVHLYVSENHKDLITTSQGIGSYRAVSISLADSKSTPALASADADIYDDVEF